MIRTVVIQRHVLCSLDWENTDLVTSDCEPSRQAHLYDVIGRLSPEPRRLVMIVLGEGRPSQLSSRAQLVHRDRFVGFGYFHAYDYSASEVLLAPF